MKTIITLITASISVILSITTASASNMLSGVEVAEKVNQRNEGNALSRRLVMELTDRNGKTRTRETRTFRKYYEDEKRTAIFYVSPKNIKDTAFLTFDYADKQQDDDQWLYLPAMRKVRRISSSDRGDYFLGTDFTYEEIKLETRVSMDDYNRKVIGEDQVDGFHCLVVEATAINHEIAAELGHNKRQDCIDDNIWIMRKSVLWNEKGQLLKTIYFKDIEQVQGIWSVKLMEVKNHQTQHHSIFYFSEIDYQPEISDKLFSQNSIKRGL